MKFLLFGIYFARAVAVLLFLAAPKTPLTSTFCVGAGVTWLATVRRQRAGGQAVRRSVSGNAVRADAAVASDRWVLRRAGGLAVARFGITHDVVRGCGLARVAALINLPTARRGCCGRNGLIPRLIPCHCETYDEAISGQYGTRPEIDSACEPAMTLGEKRPCRRNTTHHRRIFAPDEACWRSARERSWIRAAIIDTHHHLGSWRPSLSADEYCEQLRATTDQHVFCSAIRCTAMVAGGTAAGEPIHHRQRR